MRNETMNNIYTKLTWIVLCFIAVASLSAQPKYRTFSQFSLSEKKAKAGKILSSNSSFIFKNDVSGITVNGLHARFNSAIISILDSGGFTSIEISEKRKTITATGRTIAAGDSAILTFNLEKKAPGAQTNFWWWELDGSMVGTRREGLAGTFEGISIQPNGGNLLEFIYKRIVHRPLGVVVGMMTDTNDVGWVRYKTADRKFFPHTNPARCFDRISTGSAITHPFDRELKNPHVKKHNNHLLGEVHALKLAVIANDSGATQPLDTTALGDLIYNDLGNPGDPGNGLTIRQLIFFVDSALTYCDHFNLNPEIYAKLDTCVSRINRAFDGDYIAISLFPFIVAGTHSVAEYSFIHPNPTAAPFTRRSHDYSMLDQQPEQFLLLQNYPNPFNPTTTISFSIAQEGRVTLKVYNMLGQNVATLLNNEVIDEGEREVEFDASTLTSGIYLYRVEVTNVSDPGKMFTQVNKMLLVK
jgi:hypothetical protein